MSELSTLRIANALSVAAKYGTIDGSHHKQWVIDQMVRALLGLRGNTGPNGTLREHEPNRETYDNWTRSVSNQNANEWDTGVAP